MVREQFSKLKTREDVAEILQISDGSLRYFLYGIRPDNMYLEFEIPKRNGGVRKICAPNSKLKSIQRKLANILYDLYVPKKAAYGFVRGQSNVENAFQHCRRKWIFNIDLKDFFSQIHFGRVMGLFMAAPYCIGQEAAVVLAQIVCYKGKLPQGAPTSPIITNMVCRSLDNELTQLAKKYHIVYTRYADDITFSSYKNSVPNGVVIFNQGVVNIGDELRIILQNNSFEVNPAKIHFRTNNSRQEVTGLVVNQFTNVRREYIRQIRVMLYSCETIGILESALKYIELGYCHNSRISALGKKGKLSYEEESTITTWYRAVIKGKIEYLRRVRGQYNHYYMKYAKKANEIFGNELFEITENDLEKTLSDAVYVLENSEDGGQGSGFLLKGYGFFTNYHVIDDNGVYDVFDENRVPRGIVGIEHDNTFICGDEKIDYALFRSNMSKTHGLSIGDSDKIKRGMEITVAGFPNYHSGNSLSIMNTHITADFFFYGNICREVANPIFHGMSGGVAVDKDGEVIGIVVSGKNSANDESETKSGIIPISRVINDVRRKMGDAF